MRKADNFSDAIVIEQGRRYFLVFSLCSTFLILRPWSYLRMSTSTNPSADPSKNVHEHHFLKFVLKFVVGFLIFCVAFELVLRLMGYGHYTVYRPDERLLWVPEAG